MVVKSDYSPAPIGQRPANHPRNFHTTGLRQSAVRLVTNAGLLCLTFFAVFSGLTGSQEDLEKMGIYPGPTHS